MVAPHITRAIVSRDTFVNGGWKLEHVSVREPEEGEVLVEMVGSGICHTDALVGGIAAGEAPLAFYPRVLGHEGSGYVKKLGPGVTVAEVGDPVLLSYNFCDQCPLCKAQRQPNCRDFTSLNFGPHNVFGEKDGEEYNIHGQFFGQSSFANLSIVSQQSIVNVKGLVKDKKELQLLSPLGCGIQTGSGSVINIAKATPDDIVLVLGIGGVGLSAVMAASIQKCRKIIALDKVQSRLELARELGATDVINGGELGEKSIVDAVRELTDGLGAHVVLEATGAPALIKAGVEATRNSGKYIQVGSPPHDFQLGVEMQSFLLSGKHLIGAIEGQAYPPDYVPQMITWYREGRFPIDKFFEFIPVEEFDKGMHAMHDGTMVKPILCWS